MSMRFSVDEALKRGWITPQQAEQQRRRGQDRRPLIDTQQPPKARLRTPAFPVDRERPERQVCSLDGDLPQEKLWRACVRHWPHWVAEGHLVWEFPGAVPGRRFRLDIGFPHQRLAVEVDGWEHHGKYLADFKRDRARDRALVQQGWRVLRFYAEEIHSDSEKLVEEIEKALFHTPCC